MFGWWFMMPLLQRPCSCQQGRYYTPEEAQRILLDGTFAKIRAGLAELPPDALAELLK